MRTLFLALLVFTSLSAHATPRTAPEITAIDVKVFDRGTGKLVDVGGELSDPYGVNVDLFVVVKLKGLVGEQLPASLRLKATTERTFDEARGETRPTRQDAKKIVSALSETGEVQVPFLLDFVCNEMTIRAEMPAFRVVKAVKVPLACAE